MRRLPSILLLCACAVLSATAGTPRVRVGADVLFTGGMDLLAGKRVGVITNQSARCASGAHLVDELLRRGVHVTALFAPEHGIRGAEEAGRVVRDTIDVVTGLPVYSLYGAAHAPTQEMLSALDVLVYDIQDAGVRYYSFIATMIRSMEAAAARGIPFVVLDRPDPLGGLVVDGPVLPDSLRSFMGPLPVPVVYGLTPGELAAMANGEGWLRGGARVRLTVVPMEGWTRHMRWAETGLEWVPPSPNMRTPETSEVYPLTSLLEATNFSEGRGTPEPFLTIGAPFVTSSRSLANLLQGEGRGGMTASPVEFTPVSSKHRGVLCRGVRIQLSSVEEPVGRGLALLSLLHQAYPDSLTISPLSLARLLGDAGALHRLLRGENPREIAASWRPARDQYVLRSRMYRRYPDM
jgi:uncharacterized protein YbbC (DUF1343 family)